MGWQRTPLEKRGDAVSSPTDPQVPSAERRAEVKKMWPSAFTFPTTYDRPSFWGLISALDAQSAERTREPDERERDAYTQGLAHGQRCARAEVEKMREAAAKTLQRLIDFPTDCDRLGSVDPSTGVAECSLEIKGRDCLCAHRNEALEEGVQAIRALSIEGTSHRSSCWVIKYEDAEVNDEVFSGNGAESAARERFKIQSDSWNCWLLADVDCSFPIEGTEQ